MFKLTHSALDEDEESAVFPTREEAIEAAVAWFLSGYEDIQTIAGINVSEDVDELRADLLAGKDFYCANFYERASISPA